MGEYSQSANFVCKGLKVTANSIVQLSYKHIQLHVNILVLPAVMLSSCKKLGQDKFLETRHVPGLINTLFPCL